MITIAVTVLLLLTLIAYQKFNNAVYRSKKRLEGKTALITGGTSGLGLEIAQDFAKRGARVIVACPFEEEGQHGLRAIIENSGNNNVEYKHLDLSSLKSVRAFACNIMSTEQRLDILVNNAGVGIPRDFMTKDGMNFIMQVNYYGHFLLTLLLLPLLRKTGSKSDPARVINMSSITHWMASSDVGNYNRAGYWYKLRIYSNSKLSFVFFAKELSQRLEGSNVVVNCADPGFAATRIYNSASEFLGFLAITLILLFAKNSFEGAQTAIYLGVDDAGKVSGGYFENCRRIQPRSIANDEKCIKKLWEQSVKLVGLSDNELKELLCIS